MITQIRSKKILVASVILIVIIIGGTTIAKCMTNKKVTERDGYKVIRDVQGIEFQVNKEFSDYSTAVLEISKNIDFSDYQTYSYKDGQNMYLLFNMRSYIIIAKKGTCFDFQSQGLEESLSKNSLNGIWFEPNGKNPVIESSADRYTVSVTAQVVITPLVYNDFRGTLTTITKNSEEWAFFAGTVSQAQNYFVESINYTADSIVSVDTEETIPSEYAIVDSVSKELSNEEDASASEMDKKEDDLLLSVETSGSTFQINENQMRFDLEQGNVYESSPYAMLGIGNAGIVSIVNDNGGGYTNAYVRIDKLYSQKEAEEIIQEYIAAGESYYLDMNAPEGMHFEAVSYSTMFLDPEPSYVNIRICGLDGEDLRYRGVIYPHSTYDINSKVKLKDDWNSGYICFYAVPNGCTEYALSCGPGVEKDDQYSAYFYIKSKK